MNRGLMPALIAAFALLAMPPVAGAGPLVITKGKTVTLSPGTHHYDSVLVHSGGTLKITGDTTLVVGGDVTVQGAHYGGEEAYVPAGLIDGSRTDFFSSYGSNGTLGTSGFDGYHFPHGGSPGGPGSQGGPGFMPGNVEYIPGRPLYPLRGYHLGLHSAGCGPNMA